MTKNDYMGIKPITPQQAKSNRVAVLPSAVLEAFNELITENLDGKSATIGQNEAIALIQKKLTLTDGGIYHLSAQEICDKGWLNIEDVYREAGWKVAYDKPGYNETYEATFKFTVK